MGLMREKVATSCNHQHKQEVINMAPAHTSCPLPAIQRQRWLLSIQWKRNSQPIVFDIWFYNKNERNVEFHSEDKGFTFFICQKIIDKKMRFTSYETKVNSWKELVHWTSRRVVLLQNFTNRCCTVESLHLHLLQFNLPDAHFNPPKSPDGDFAVCSLTLNNWERPVGL